LQDVPRRNEVEIKQVQEQLTASIRVRTPVAGLKDELGKAYGEILASLSRQGVAPGKAAFAIYYNMDMSDLDVEMGFLVASPCRADGRMKPSTIPGGRAAFTLHKGPYDTMEGTYNALTAFMAEKKVTPQGLCYEMYLTGPETPPADTLTEVYFPLA
jgi:effector-binding domain-containing protein